MSGGGAVQTEMSRTTYVLEQPVEQFSSVLDNQIAIRGQLDGDGTWHACQLVPNASGRGNGWADLVDVVKDLVEEQQHLLAHNFPTGRQQET